MKKTKRGLMLVILLLNLGNIVFTPRTVFGGERQTGKELQLGNEYVKEPFEYQQTPAKFKAGQFKATQLPNIRKIEDKIFVLPANIPIAESEYKPADEELLMKKIFNPDYTLAYIRQAAQSTSEQEAMLAKSQEHAQLQQAFHAKTGYTIENIRTIEETVIRLLPKTGEHFTHDRFYLFRIRETGQIAFCLEEAVPVGFGGGGVVENFERVINDPELRERISLIAYYGWYGEVNQSDKQYVTVQQMIWEEFGGTTLYTSVSDYSKRRQEINQKIENYQTRPSFHQQTITIKPGETITLTDSNQVFSEYLLETLVNTADVTVNQNGHQLEITADDNAQESGEINFSRIPKEFSHPPLVYHIPNYQRVGVLHVENAICTTLNIDVLSQGHAQVQKLDYTTGRPLAGAVFKLTMGNGEEQELTTDSNGVAEFRDLQVGTKVTIEEISAPNGYLINQIPQTITIQANETTIVTFENHPQLGQLQVHKTVNTSIGTTKNESAFGTYKTIDFAQKDGAGFAFKIRPTEDIITGEGTLRYPAGEFLQDNGQEIMWTTDKEGTFTTEPILHIGKYEIVEVDAPYGVILLNEPMAFEISYAGQMVEFPSTSLLIENELQEINIFGKKKEERIKEWEDGQAVIELKKANNNQVFALRLTDKLRVGDEVLPADTTLGYSIVADGLISFEKLRLPNQEIELYLQEVLAAPEHVLDETKYHFVYQPENNEAFSDIDILKMDAEMSKENQLAELQIQHRDQKIDLTDLVEGTVSDSSQAIVNRLARANLKVLKIDGLDRKPLAGVEFKLFRMDDRSDIAIGKAEIESKTSDDEESLPPGGTLIGAYLTNAVGEIIIENLPTGNYLLVETAPLDWYQINKEEYQFEVKPENDGEIHEFTIVNHRYELAMETLFVEAETGNKVVDPTLDISLIDYAWFYGGKEQQEYHVVTQFIHVETQQVIDELISSFVSSGEEKQELLFEVTIPANTMKLGDELVATHMVYSDKTHQNLVTKHFDLEDKEQTVRFETRENTSKEPAPLLIPQAGSYNAWEEFKTARRIILSLFK